MSITNNLENNTDIPRSAPTLSRFNNGTVEVAKL